jgi:hypothetical protein
MGYLTMHLLKYLLVALFLPMAAQAAPLIEGGNTVINAGVLYEYDETLINLAAGSHVLTFGLTTLASPGNALTTEISLGANDITFDFFRATGPNGVFNATDVAIGAGGNGFLAFIADIPFVIGGLYDLELGFTLDNAANVLANVQVNAIPLPAAGLLLLGAMGVLGAASRRKIGGAA